ncbi:MAG TPA: hypothetical protein VGJ95_24750, partial [Pseudonocardiaceae bacterium]
MIMVGAAVRVPEGKVRNGDANTTRLDGSESDGVVVLCTRVEAIDLDSAAATFNDERAGWLELKDHRDTWNCADVADLENDVGRLSG